jgi:hypothetical protein
MNNPLSGMDTSGLANDCAGPCTPFSYVGDFGCTVYVTYYSDYAGYDIPIFTVKCPGGGTSSYGGGPDGQGAVGGGNLAQNYCASQGSALSPHQYAAQGANFAAGISTLGQSYGPDVASSFALGALFGQFSRGSSLDAQPRATGTSLQRASYGNYVFGAFFAGAGVPLSDALAAANTYGFKQQVVGGAYQGRNMDNTFTHLPAVNVQDIRNGYRDAQLGSLCHQ